MTNRRSFFAGLFATPGALALHENAPEGRVTVTEHWVGNMLVRSINGRVVSAVRHDKRPFVIMTHRVEIATK